MEEVIGDLSESKSSGIIEDYLEPSKSTSTTIATYIDNICEEIDYTVDYEKYEPFAHIVEHFSIQLKYISREKYVIEKCKHLVTFLEEIFNIFINWFFKASLWKYVQWEIDDMRRHDQEAINVIATIETLKSLSSTIETNIDDLCVEFKTFQWFFFSSI